MTSAFTVVLPHRRNPGNDDALAICLDCVAKNTINDYSIIVDAATDQPLYPRINAMIQQATTDCVVYLASDTFFGPAWDVPMLATWNADTLVTNCLVEPGAIGLHPNNMQWDFGRKPSTFRRAEFEAWCATAGFGDNEGWYCPYMISRSSFLALGGFKLDLPTDGQGFSSADITLFEDWKTSGRRVQRVQSYAYHLQRWSEPGEQHHDKRNIAG